MYGNLLDYIHTKILDLILINILYHFFSKDRRIFNGAANEHSSHCNRKDVLSIETKFKESQRTHRTAKKIGNVKTHICVK
jgi:hypothetical protein